MSHPPPPPPLSETPVSPSESASTSPSGWVPTPVHESDMHEAEEDAPPPLPEKPKGLVGVLLGSHRNRSSSSTAPYAPGRPARLYRSSKTFILEAQDASWRECLVFDRHHVGRVSFEDRGRVLGPWSSCTHMVYAVLGILRAAQGAYLMVVTGVRVAATLPGGSMLQITSVATLPFEGAPLAAPRSVSALEKIGGGFSRLGTGILAVVGLNAQADMLGSSLPQETPIVSLKNYLESGWFFMSYDFDVTTAVQRHMSRVEASGISEPHYHADRRFVWNSKMMEDLVRVGASAWITPIVQGWVDVRRMSVGGKIIELLLVSRRSSRRAGTRFMTRGIDDDGYVGNFVESEMVVIHGDEFFSFIVLRGTVPLFWEEQPGSNGNRVRISRGLEASQPAFRRHFTMLQDEFGPVVAVNLLTDNKPGEKQLSNLFARQASLLVNEAGLSCETPAQRQEALHVGYIHFDVHSERRTGPECLSVLMRMCDEELNSFGYFHATLAPRLHRMSEHERRSVVKVHRTQVGVFRVSCRDCLDRTNAVQAVFSRAVLEAILHHLGLLPWDTSIHHDTESIFTDMWQRHGDTIAMQCVGTGSLAATFGTVRGGGGIATLLDDATKAVMRSYSGAVHDAERQATITLLLGHHHNDIPLSERELRIRDKLAERRAEYTRTETLSMRVVTWNIAGDQSISEAKQSLHPLFGLEGENPPDLLVFGLQEVVPLTYDQVFSMGESERERWDRRLVKEADMAYGRHGVSYVRIHSKQLVGVYLCILARVEHAPTFREVSCGVIKLGWAGYAGNKGSVAIRFAFHSTTFCLVCSHFTHGRDRPADRNGNYMDVMTRLGLAVNSDQPRGIADHDVVFWFGDLNYHIDLGRDTVERKIHEQDWEYLLKYDQLCTERFLGRVFAGFIEPAVRFAPTYKYDVGTQIYDTSPKVTVPAWTDRVLWRGDGVEACKYGRIELLPSDHRPVFCECRVAIHLTLEHELEEVRRHVEVQVDRTQGDAENDPSPSPPPLPPPRRS